MNLDKTHFADIYNSACYATDRLSQARYWLGCYNYLTNDEHKLLRQALHLLYEKIVTVGADIEDYKAFEICHFDIPESKEEQNI